MKKIACIFGALAVIAMVGCAKGTPEDAARDIVEKQIATKHKGFILDTSDLEYRVIEEGEDFALVVVAGDDHHLGRRLGPQHLPQGPEPLLRRVLMRRQPQIQGHHPGPLLAKQAQGLVGIPGKKKIIPLPRKPPLELLEDVFVVVDDE